MPNKWINIGNIICMTMHELYSVFLHFLRPIDLKYYSSSKHSIMIYLADANLRKVAQQRLSHTSIFDFALENMSNVIGAKFNRADYLSIQLLYRNCG